MSPQTKPDISPGLQGLSLFRILFGGLLLFDFVFKLLPYFPDFFSDSGFFTRAIGQGVDGPSVYLSLLHWLDAPWQLGLFSIIYAAALVCFIAGYQTRVAKFVVFAGYVALYYRNTMITSGADMLSRVFLLWCLFVPLNRYWSVDSALSRAPRQEPVEPIFLMGMKLQICMLYLFGALFKLAGAPWQDGTAPFFAMHDGAQGSPFGTWFADSFSYRPA